MASKNRHRRVHPGNPSITGNVGVDVKARGIVLHRQENAAIQLFHVAAEQRTQGNLGRVVPRGSAEGSREIQSRQSFRGILDIISWPGFRSIHLQRQLLSPLRGCSEPSSS